MENLNSQLQQLIENGEALVTNCERNLGHVSGIKKFETRIRAELKSLRSLVEKRKLEERIINH